VQRLAAVTYAMARDAAAAEVPEGTSKEEWDKHIAYARDVELYAEYALFAVELIRLGRLRGRIPRANTWRMPTARTLWR
jgi:hypothetical protein